jgi:small conductance mechanosensitive channel
MLGRFISIAVVMAVALIVWEVGTAFGERIALRNPASMRLKTLLPFLLNGFRIVLLTLVSLIVLSELGVNIAPLLAGAGVFGLALGFGAQTLVKDVITGVFILIEDTISVGDVVEVGTHSGLVEKISVRTVHLRDFDGNVHTIPFGEVQTIKNMSKVFAYAVVDVTVSYRENIDEALALMAEVAEGMTKSGPLAETIIGPFEVVGVEGLQESAVWLRGRFKTRPLGQWNVRREFYRRIKAAFDERGIEIPYPHRTIYLGADKKGAAAPLHIVNDHKAPGRPRGAKRTAAPAAEESTGPLIEEHPGARERSGSDDDLLVVEERSP